jgi:glutamate-1-semialdehyde 2,1-aminomutase
LGLGGAQEYYGVKPDLCTLGKNLGGGLPVSAVAGRSDIMELADVTNKSKTQRCWIGGGTFSENALCMSAGLATIRHLMKNRKSIYRKIDKLGDSVRKSTDKIFAENGLRTKSTGAGSLFATHFLSDGQENIASPTDVNASNRVAEKRYYFSMIARDGIYYLPGHVGAVSTAHEKSDIDDFLASTRTYAKKIGKVQ